jgi:uncharacterized protein YggE
VSFGPAIRGFWPAEPDPVSEALGRANATSRRALAALREKGVRADDIQTTGLSIDSGTSA